MNSSGRNGMQGQIQSSDWKPVTAKHGKKPLSFSGFQINWRQANALRGPHFDSTPAPVIAGRQVPIRLSLTDLEVLQEFAETNLQFKTSSRLWRYLVNRLVAQFNSALLVQMQLEGVRDIRGVVARTRSVDVSLTANGTRRHITLGQLECCSIQESIRPIVQLIGSLEDTFPLNGSEVPVYATPLISAAVYRRLSSISEMLCVSGYIRSATSRGPRRNPNLLLRLALHAAHRKLSLASPTNACWLGRFGDNQKENPLCANFPAAFDVAVAEQRSASIEQQCAELPAEFHEQIMRQWKLPTWEELETEASYCSDEIQFLSGFGLFAPFKAQMLSSYPCIASYPEKSLLEPEPEPGPDLEFSVPPGLESFGVSKLTATATTTASPSPEPVPTPRPSVEAMLAQLFSSIPTNPV